MVKIWFQLFGLVWFECLFVYGHGHGQATTPGLHININTFPFIHGVKRQKRHNNNNEFAYYIEVTSMNTYTKTRIYLYKREVK